MDPSTWGGFSHRTRENMWYPLLPCLQCLWHCVILPWQIKLVCLENNVCDEVSNTFARLSECPSAVEDSDLQALERFVLLMYDSSSDVTTVKKASLDLFARKTIWLDPTNSSSTQRACQTCFLWGWIHIGTGIEATSTNAEPKKAQESLLDSTSTYCGELLGVDQMWVY